jgi:hypothetical protein
MEYVLTVYGALPRLLDNGCDHIGQTFAILLLEDLGHLVHVDVGLVLQLLLYLKDLRLELIILKKSLLILPH